MATEHIDRDDLTRLESVPAVIGERIAATKAAEDPTELPRRQQAALEAIYPDGGVRRLVPHEVREDICRQVEADYRDQMEQGALYELGAEVHGGDVERLIERVSDAALRPPSARGTWMGRHQLSSVSQTDALLIEVVDGQRTERAERQLRNAPPSAVLYAYVYSDDDTTGSTRRWIEQTHGDGWNGVQTDDPRELEAILGLRRVIEDDRKARIPASVDAARQALGHAADVLRRLEVVRGLAPRRPNGL